MIDLKNVQCVIFDSWERFDDESFKYWVKDTKYVQDMDEDRQWEAFSDYIWDCLEDERTINLDIPTEGRIVAYGYSEGWNGTSRGGLPMGYNVNSIFDFPYEDEVSFYVDEGEVHVYAPGHDGATGAVFREVDDDYLEKLEEEGVTNEKEFYERSRSIAGYVADVYGFRL